MYRIGHDNACVRSTPISHSVKAYVQWGKSGKG